jgi:predicted GNAT family acetyltransferase
MADTKQPIHVIDNPDAERYEAQLDGEVGFLAYSQHGDRIVLIHTEVPSAIEGRGVAASLAKYALEDAHRRHWSVIPSCPYVLSYIRRHPEYLPLVAESWRGKAEQPATE